MELCPFVILVWKSCQLFNFKTILDIFMKLNERSVDVKRIKIITSYKVLMMGLARVGRVG